MNVRRIERACNGRGRRDASDVVASNVLLSSQEIARKEWRPSDKRQRVGFEPRAVRRYMPEQEAEAKRSRRLTRFQPRARVSPGEKRPEVFVFERRLYRVNL